MKVLIDVYLLKQTENSNVIPKNIYEGAKIGFGPYSFYIHITDMNGPTYEWPDWVASSETNIRFRPHSYTYLWRSMYLFWAYFVYISFNIGSRAMNDPVYERSHWTRYFRWAELLIIIVGYFYEGAKDFFRLRISFFGCSKYNSPLITNKNVAKEPYPSARQGPGVSGKVP